MRLVYFRLPVIRMAAAGRVEAPYNWLVLPMIDKKRIWLHVPSIRCAAGAIGEKSTPVEFAMESIVRSDADRQLATMAGGVASERDDVLRAVHRLESLYTEINALNDALQEMLSSDSSISSPPKPRHRRRTTATTALARFRQQVKKLTVYAPY
jgi:hypothetical protein